jgi:hypothetical protein
MRKVCNILVEKPEEKRPRKWGGNAAIDFREIGREGVNWVHLAQDGDQWRAMMNTVLDFRIP